MVLIVTQDSDGSSKQVLQWVQHLGQEWYQISASDTIDIIEYRMESGRYDFSFSHNGNVLRLSQFTAIWFRRGWFTMMYKPLDILSGTLTKREVRAIENHVKEELKTFQEYLYQSLSRQAYIFGNVNQYNVNKLDVLLHAHEVGLYIPEYCITTLKPALINFQKKHKGKVLSKAIRENIDYKTETSMVFHTNKVFSHEDIQCLPEHFQPTLFQVYCEKHFEIRVFVFGENMYAMAIFSQQNEKTKTDYRNYDNQKPTRCLPYTIPLELQEKIMKLMEALKLKTGSIDFMYSKQNEYVFLEVNPVGQFGIVSRSGNYHIEKKIAETLIA